MWLFLNRQINALQGNSFNAFIFFGTKPLFWTMWCKALGPENCPKAHSILISEKNGCLPHNHLSEIMQSRSGRARVSVCWSLPPSSLSPQLRSVGRSHVVPRLPSRGPALSQATAAGWGWPHLQGLSPAHSLGHNKFLSGGQVCYTRGKRKLPLIRHETVHQKDGNLKIRHTGPEGGASTEEQGQEDYLQACLSPDWSLTWSHFTCDLLSYKSQWILCFFCLFVCFVFFCLN